MELYKVKITDLAGFHHIQKGKLIPRDPSPLDQRQVPSLLLRKAGSCRIHRPSGLKAFQRRKR